jgi:hypothetical protein
MAEKRVVVERIAPQIDGSLFPIKRVIGEKVSVKAHVFADGHVRLPLKELGISSGQTYLVTDLISDDKYI